MALHGIHCESSIELQDYPKFRKDELFFTSILSCNKKCLRKAYINLYRFRDFENGIMENHFKYNKNEIVSVKKFL